MLRVVTEFKALLAKAGNAVYSFYPLDFGVSVRLSSRRSLSRTLKQEAIQKNECLHN
jgi:hypothetical protein